MMNDQQMTTVVDEQQIEIKDVNSALVELIELLNDEDEVVVLSSLKVVRNLFQISKHKYIAMACNALIRTIINLALKSDDDHPIVKYVAAILNDLAELKAGLSVLFDNGALHVIYKLLQSGIESVTCYGITTLHSMLLKLKPANIAVRKTGGIYYIVQLLSRHNSTKFLAIVADCLRSLAYGSQDGKELILEYGGTYELIRIFNTYDHEKLLWTVARCIKILSVCPKNKQLIVDTGGVQIMSKHLNHSSSRLVMNSLWAIRNLSNLASDQQNLADLIQALVYLLHNNKIHIVSCVACILSNLTCNNPFNKETLYQANGIPVLIQTLIRANECRLIIEPVLTTLRHLTTKHLNADNCRNLIRLNYGIPPVIRYLHSPFKWSTTKSAIDFIRNVALSPANHEELREINLIERLLRLLSKCNQEIKRTFTTKENMEICVFDGVKVQQIIENILYIFMILAHDETNCRILVNLDLIPLCYDLICYQNDNMVKLAVNCLSYLAHLPSGAEKISCEDTNDVFKRLILSSDKDLCQNAQLILLSINEYRNSLNSYT